MINGPKIRKIYEEIQSKLFYMIPEKWDRLYLYASVVDHSKNDYTGEMFFYYFPKSIIKKNPVNVYEVPNRFSIDEESYLKLAKELYEKIKELRVEMLITGEKPWSNMTVSIEDATFKVEFYYEELEKIEVNHYYRHLLWRYRYLGVPIESYSKKDQDILERAIARERLVKKEKKVYTQGIYKEKTKKIIEYEHSKEENVQEQEQTEIKSQILNIDREQKKDR